MIEELIPRMNPGAFTRNDEERGGEEYPQFLKIS
jgi:hypothetical protein